MLKSRNNKIRAGSNPNFSKDSIRINAGSIILDNKWINYKGTVFRVEDYINSAVVGSRTRFFKNRGFAVYLLIGIDAEEGVKVIEGNHVKFSTIDAVPPPTEFNIAPLLGLVLVQDGTSDLNLGYKPLKDEYIRFFSGSGNIITKNLKGPTGDESTAHGATGLIGETGIIGYAGETGPRGLTGVKGMSVPGIQGHTGAPGMTGISWDIDIPFEEFF